MSKKEKQDLYTTRNLMKPHEWDETGKTAGDFIGKLIAIVGKMLDPDSNGKRK